MVDNDIYLDDPWGFPFPRQMERKDEDISIRDVVVRFIIHGRYFWLAMAAIKYHP